ncbi:glutathione synthase [bacterium]|jgi:glutathione synthase|nr:glutathione synthase [bacterium]
MKSLVFIMDPLESVNPIKDTGFDLMRAAYQLDYRIVFIPMGGVSKWNDQIRFSGNIVVPSDSDLENPFIIGDSVEISDAEITAIFIRKEPPFNSTYLTLTWLLDHVSIPVINSPSGLRTVNEKLWCSQFTSIVPPTLFTRYKADFQLFLDEHKTVVVKPLNGFGGSQVFIVNQGDTNQQVIFESVTNNGSEEAIVQTYLPDSKNGDKRVLLLDGEPLGAVLRVHSNTDHRNNMFAGGTTEPAVVTESDLYIISILKPHLLALGLRFVGIDIIGDKLIEVNITSPTCLQEMSRFNKEDLAVKVIKEIMNV